MRSYCSIFDKNYLFQGLTVFKSLSHSSVDYTYYPLCMDNESYELLIKMNLEKMQPILVDEIMTEELYSVRQKTTKGQFCWVCQPIICQYILDTYHAEIVIYLEADSLFFSDPEILLREMIDYSVSLVPHNFSPEFDNSAVAGRYCVQFNAFRNDEKARGVLNYWKNNCFKYTDQKLEVYPGQTCLDHWVDLFEGVKSIENIGAGVAPWNVNKFKVSAQNGIVYVDEFPIVFYHFHQYGRYTDGSHELGNYPYSKEVKQLIYSKYIAELNNVVKLVHLTDPTFNFRRLYSKDIKLDGFSVYDFKKVFHAYWINIKRILRGRYNIYPNCYFDK